MLNPSASSPSLIELYEFLGVLFGCCIRTGVRCALDCAPFVWKAIADEELVKADLSECEGRVWVWRLQLTFRSIRHD